MKMMIKKTIKNCCATAETLKHPDHSAEIKRINRIRGQLDGIKKMIEDGRYCPDIITQTSAARSAIAALEAAILEKHLLTCVRTAFSGGSADATEKVAELLEIFKLKAK